MRRYILPVGLALASSCAPVSQKSPSIATGPWHAWLDGPGGNVPFDFEIISNDGCWSARIRNAEEIIQLPTVRWEKQEIVIPIDAYQAELRASKNKDGTELNGRWKKMWGVGKSTGLDFHAVAGSSLRFPKDTHTNPSSIRHIGGRWLIFFADREYPSVGIFDTDSTGTIHGTFLNTTGDYRYLSGSLVGDRLRLSRFDGGAAFLFEAVFSGEDSLRGQFWEGDYYQDTWIGRRDPEAQLVDTFGIFKITGDVDLSEVGLLDLEGRRRTLADPAFSGKLLLIEILGTWCPNCQDGSAFLKDLYLRYHDRGLSVLGIAFEFSDRFQDNVVAVQRYRDRHGLPYPLLLAWKDQPRSPSVVFPAIEGEFAFPSFLFIDPSGRIRAATTGFIGPAGGEDHLRLEAKFEELIRDVLAGKQS